MTTFLKIQNIKEKDKTPLVTELIEIVYLLQEEIQKLKDEIAILKGLKRKGSGRKFQSLF
ncbi:MAG: hypothetical protein HQK79_23185 [Desulfobacterales bacterium]|nr:hypothetical protein [Desulfobacterales bacterium]